MPSENGWNPAKANGATDCEWVRIPGAEHVSLQFLKGWPSTILRAYAADYHAYIEPLRDADSASYTATNSVATSNHLNGTAMDLNWNSHPFQVDYAGFDVAKRARMRELLAFYNFEGLQVVFWAQDWRSPKDAMHHQMGYNTWNNPIVKRFIDARIRPDGFSTYKRSGTAPVSKADGYALAVMAEGQRRGITPRGIQIAFSVVFVESGWKMYANSTVPASLLIPHDAVGSDYDSVGLFQQRCPMWGPAAVLMDPAKSAGLFYDRLVKLDYNGPRPAGDYAADVQRPAKQYRGRYQERMADAIQLYNRLVSQPDPWEELLMEPVESWSIYATPGEPKIPVVNLIQAIDAKNHRDLTDEDAKAGDPEAIRRVARTAAGLGKAKNPGAIAHAAKVLNEIQATNPQYILAATPGRAS